MPHISFIRFTPPMHDHTLLLAYCASMASARRPYFAGVFLGERFADDFAASPVILVDVGGRGGVRGRWVPLQAILHSVLFEPDPAGAPQSQGARTTVVPIALADEPGSRLLYVLRRGTKSSLFPPNPRYLARHPRPEAFDVMEEVQVEVDTLDRCLPSLALGGVDVLKIDVQGAELDVLRGGRRLLDDDVVAIDVEVNFEQRYTGIPLFCDIDPFLRARGFELFDLQRNYLKRRAGLPYGAPQGQLSFGKAIYYRGPEEIERLVSLAGSDARRRLLRTLVAVAAYGYLDYLAELLDRCGAVLDPDEAAFLRRSLEAQVPLHARLPALAVRDRLGRTAERFDRVVRSYSAGGRWSDRSLGNR